MLEFSELLRKMIEDKKELSVYAIAKEAGIDRSSLQKVLTGNRELGIEYIRPLCDCLKKYCSTIKVDEMYEVYAKKYWGYRRYHTLQFIKERLEETGKSEKYAKEICEKKEFQVGQFIEEQKIPKEEKKILQRIYELYRQEQGKEDGYFYLYIPSKWKELRQMLMYLLIAEKDIWQKERVKLSFSNIVLEGENKEITLIDNYLTLCELTCYEIHGYSDVLKTRDCKEEMMPYYVLTSQAALFMSVDRLHLLETGEKDLIKYFSERFENSLEKKDFRMYPLTLERYGADFLPGKMIDGGGYSLAYKICDGPFYTEELLKKMLDENFPARNLVIACVADTYQKYREEGVNVIFSMKYLFDFAQPPKELCVSPFYITKEIRYEILKTVYDYFREHEKMSVSLFLPERMSMNNQMHLSVCGLSGMNFIYHRDNRSVLLNEMNFMQVEDVSKIMSDFWNYIKNSSVCLSKTESLELIEKCLAAMREK